MAIITRQGKYGEEILFIERATRTGDPWSGHIAFPGGKKQDNDNSICATAIRETQEEIGLNLLQTSRSHRPISRPCDTSTQCIKTHDSNTLSISID